MMKNSKIKGNNFLFFNSMIFKSVKIEFIYFIFKNNDY